MYTAKKYAFAGAVGVSLIALCTGLAASAPDPNAADRALAAQATTSAARDPVQVATPVTTAAPVTLTRPDTSALEAPGALVTPDTLQKLVAVHAAHPRPVGPSTECMAKVIYHEAANQALSGQLAVAQVILNRASGGVIFPTSVCGVVNQRGQFFKTRSFRIPRHDLSRWRTAIAVAAIAQEKRLAQVAPGALFYHAAYIRPAWSQKHERIAQIGDQIFYR